MFEFGWQLRFSRTSDIGVFGVPVLAHDLRTGRFDHKSCVSDLVADTFDRSVLQPEYALQIHGYHHLLRATFFALRASSFFYMCMLYRFRKKECLYIFNP